MRWIMSPPAIDRLRLRRAALRYAAHGWPVTPGARLAGPRFSCGRPGCPTVGSHPALEAWEEAATSEAERITRWWRRQPFTVLLATGRAFDVVEVPAHLGLRVLGLARLHSGGIGPQRRQVRGPVAVTPTGRWMFFVRRGDPLRPELDGHLDVVHHGRGSWVPAPPSRLVEGPVRWAVSPPETRWELPDPYALQALLVDALALGTPPATDAAGRRSQPGAPVPAAPRTHPHPADSPHAEPARAESLRPGSRAVPQGSVPRQVSTARRAA